MYRPKREVAISPSMVKQYVYCPVIPWIMAKYNLQEPQTDSMILGAVPEKPVEDRGQILVKSRKHRASTIIDEVRIINNETTLIEYKKYPTKSIHRYLEQLKTEALIAQESIGPIRRVKLIINNKEREYVLTEDFIEDAGRILDKLLGILARDSPPQPVRNTKICSSCWYKKFCPYQ